MSERAPTPAAEFDRRVAATPEEVWGEHYEPVSAPRRRRLARLRAALDPRPGERVLDVGCGTGALTYWAAEAGARVTGLDFSRASLLVARLLARPRGGPAPAWVQADVTRLPVGAGRADKVVCVDVLDMLPPSQQPALVAELLRVVRPGGVVIVYTPNARRETLGRALRALARLRGARRPASALHLGLATPARVRALLRRSGARARVTWADMNHAWLARVPVLRGWLAGHQLWIAERSA